MPPPGRRNGKLQAGDGPSRSYHSCQFGQRRFGITDVAQQVRERQRVETGVGERESFASSEDEGCSLFGAISDDVRATAAKHVGADVEANDVRGATPDELTRDRRGTAGHVEHDPGPRRHDRVNHRRSPAAILSEGEETRQTVVSLGQVSKETTSKGIRLGTRFSHISVETAHFDGDPLCPCVAAQAGVGVR